MLAFVVLAFVGGFLSGAVAIVMVGTPSPEVDADRRSIERHERARRALTGRRFV